MGSVMLGVLVVMILYGITFIVEWLPMIVMLAAIAFVLVIFYCILYHKKVDRVVKARRICGEEPVIKRVTQKVGYTLGADYSYYDHYEIRNVITDYKVKFEVEFNDGKKDTLVCLKGSDTYEKLMNLTSCRKKLKIFS